MVRGAGLLLSLFNAIIFAAGAAVGVAAGFLLGRYREYGALVGGGVFTLPLCLLLAGVGLLLLALLAWVGVLQASSCLLYTYASLLLVVAVAEVAALTLVLVYRGRAERAVQESMKEVFGRYGEENDPAVTFALDRAQQKLQCCGVDTFQEWDNSTFGVASGDVPDGCCRTRVQGCGQGVLLRPNATTPVNATTAEAALVHPRGCFSTVRGQLVGGAPVFIASCVILVLIQTVCVYFAFSAAKKIRMTVAPST